MRERERERERERKREREERGRGRERETVYTNLVSGDQSGLSKQKWPVD